MKKIFVLIAIMALMFAVRSHAQNNVPVEDQSQALDISRATYYSDEEIQNNVFFVGQGIVLNKSSLTQNERSNYLSGIKLIFGNPDKNCKFRLEICRVKQPNSTLVFEDYSVYLPFDKINWNNFVLELAYPSKLNMNFVKFYVKEDIDVFDETEKKQIAKIYAGSYSFDKSVGKYGGYVLKAIAIKKSN